MKDKWDKEAKVGDIFIHPGRGGSSLWINKYEIVSIGEDFVKARKLNRTLWERKKWDPIMRDYRLLTDSEQAKADARTVTISTFSHRSTIL